MTDRRTQTKVSLELPRRTVLTGAGALAIAGPGGVLTAGTARAEDLTPTPRQTVGPFYPRRLPEDHDSDLVKVTGQDAQAMGTVLHLRGRVRDRNGTIIERAQVDIWQCDANGIYHHPNDRKTGRDPGFQGFGRTLTDAQGLYGFRTIRPVPYSGRTPHVHFRIEHEGGRPLATQMFDADRAERNARDWIYRNVGGDAARAAVTVRFTSAESIEPGALLGEFDIVLG